MVLCVTVPNKSPQLISAHARDNSSINVTWTGLREEDFQGASQGYKVLYKKTDSAVNYDVLTEYGPSYTTVIQNLLPGTWYTIRVLAFNVHGDGVPSEPVNVTTSGKWCELRNPPCLGVFCGKGGYIRHNTSDECRVKKKKRTWAVK